MMLIVLSTTCQIKLFGKCRMSNIGISTFVIGVCCGPSISIVMFAL